MTGLASQRDGVMPQAVEDAWEAVSLSRVPPYTVYEHTSRIRSTVASHDIRCAERRSHLFDSTLVHKLFATGNSVPVARKGIWW